MISILNSLFFGIQIFSFFNINSSSIYYSLLLRILTSVFFISFTTLTTLSFPFAFFIFSTISTLDSSTTTFTKPQIYFYFISFWFSLLFSTSTFQSSLILSSFTFPIFIPSICFKVKSSLDRYNAHLVCLWFNFYAFIQYSRFL